MPDEEEKGFEMVDKRHRDAEPAPSEPDPIATGDDGDDELLDESEFQDGEGGYGDSGFGGAMPRLAVSDILRMTVGMLNEKAWIHMGLIPDPLSGQIERDLTEARLAIDVLADLAKHLEPHTEGAEKRELQVMVSNLRINFVQQSRQ